MFLFKWTSILDYPLYIKILLSIDDHIKVLDCLNKIKTSSRFLLRLINDILDISKIESGKMNIFIRKI